MSSIERDERVEKIRERHRMAKFAYEGQSPPIAVADIDYLLSLLDSQAANLRLLRIASRAVIHETATATRDRCVEKVREMRNNWQIEVDARRDPDNPHDYKGSYGLASGAVDACDDIITALQSLTLDQGEQEKR